MNDFGFLIEMDSSGKLMLHINEIVESCTTESDIKKLRNRIIDILGEYVKTKIENKDFTLFSILWDKIPDDGKISKFLNRLKQLKLSLDPNFYMSLLLEIPSLSIKCEKEISLFQQKRKPINNEDMLTLLQVYCTLNDIEIDLENNENCETKLVYSESDDLDQDFINRIKATPLLEREEEYRLLELAHQGDEMAKKRLVEANMRLVLKRVQGKGDSGISFMDLIQEGALGLMKAIEKYDLEKKCKFSTYAVPWIDCYWKEALAEKSTIIGKSEHDQEKMKKFIKAKEELSAKRYKEATFEETAAYLNLSKKQTEWMRRLLQEVVSLEKPMFDDSEETFGEYIEDKNFVIPEEIAIQVSLQEEIKNQLLTKLTEKERYVICLRFGLIDGRIYTLKALGD